MIRMCVEGSELLTISQLLVWNLLFVLCQWDLMRVIIHFSLGWNQIQFNLSDFTRRAYGSNYIETLRVTIHANCRIRRIYFSDRLYSEEELPPEFKLFLPIQKQQWVTSWSYFIIFASKEGILENRKCKINRYILFLKSRPEMFYLSEFQCVFIYNLR